MATQVQDVEYHSAASGTSHPITVAATGAANLLVLVIGTTVASAPATTVSSISGDGVWVKKVAVAATHRCGAEIWFIKSSTGAATTITITLAAAASVIARFYEYSGMDTTTPDDASAATEGSSTAPTTTSGVLSTAVEIAFGINVWSSTSVTISSQTAGWTYEALSTSNNSRASVGVQTTAATTALTIAGTLSSAVSWAAAVATFLPVGNQINASDLVAAKVGVNAIVNPSALVAASINATIQSALINADFVGASIDATLAQNFGHVDQVLISSVPVQSAQASSVPSTTATPVTMAGASPVPVITSIPVR